LDAVPIVQPTVRAICRVGAPSLASNTIRARWRSRCSSFIERAKLSSSARSKSLKVIAVASGMLRMQP